LQPQIQFTIAQAKYHSSFQLTHTSCGNHAQSIANNGEDKNLLQCSQLCQLGGFWHVSISKGQRSQLGG